MLRQRGFLFGEVLLTGTLLGEVEDFLNFLHLFESHAVGFRTHRTGTHVDVGSLAEHIGLVEGIHNICSNSHSSMLLPQHHVVSLDLVEGRLCQFY